MKDYIPLSITFIKIIRMKKLLYCVCCLMLLSACGVFGSKKTGCPSSGRSVGAEKLAAGDPKAMKESKKAPKFKY
jgi:hypothetical protein